MEKKEVPSFFNGTNERISSIVHNYINCSPCGDSLLSFLSESLERFRDVQLEELALVWIGLLKVE